MNTCINTTYTGPMHANNLQGSLGGLRRCDGLMAEQKVRAAECERGMTALAHACPG